MKSRRRRRRERRSGIGGGWMDAWEGTMVAEGGLKAPRRLLLLVEEGGDVVVVVGQGEWEFAVGS